MKIPQYKTQLKKQVRIAQNEEAEAVSSYIIMKLCFVVNHFAYSVQTILYAYVRMVTVMYKYSQSKSVTKETGLNEVNNATFQVIYIHCKNVNASYMQTHMHSTSM